jgi:predicted AAA+ superfamily ATPase
MKKLIIIIGMLCLSFLSCSNEKDAKIAELTKKIDQLQKQKVLVSTKEIYELQEKCSKHAEEIFTKYYGNGISNDKDGSSMSNYTCHYNRKMNKCYVLLTFTYFSGKKKDKDSLGSTTEISLWDINENKQYGQFTRYSLGKYYFQGEVSGKHCNSEQEWDALVKPYMEE